MVNCISAGCHIGQSPAFGNQEFLWDQSVRPEPPTCWVEDTTSLPALTDTPAPDRTRIFLALPLSIHSANRRSPFFSSLTFKDLPIYKSQKTSWVPHSRVELPCRHDKILTCSAKASTSSSLPMFPIRFIPPLFKSFDSNWKPWNTWNTGSDGFVYYHSPVVRRVCARPRRIPIREVSVERVTDRDSHPGSISHTTGSSSFHITLSLYNLFLFSVCCGCQLFLDKNSKQASLWMVCPIRSEKM